MVDRQAWLQRQREKDLERLRRLRPIDDTFMRRMFQDDLPLAEFVLRIILDKPDLKLVSAETQKDLMRLVGARSICLDVHGVDSANRKYVKENVEGVSEMCRIMEELRTESIEFGREEGMEKGRREGQREGRLSTLLQSIRHLKDKLGYTDQQARDLLNISNEDWEEVAPLL